MTVEQPTMSISIGVNKTPFAGKSGARSPARDMALWPSSPTGTAAHCPCKMITSRPLTHRRVPRAAGKKLTSRNIRERLEKELETNVALQVIGNE